MAVRAPSIGVGVELADAELFEHELHDVAVVPPTRHERHVARRVAQLSARPPDLQSVGAANLSVVHTFTRCKQKKWCRKENYEKKN